MSHVCYCVQVKGSAGSVTVGKIKKIFNFADRFLCNGGKFDYISDVLINLEWLTSTQFVNHADLCMLHKLIVTGCPSVLSSRYTFNRDLVHQKTRQSGRLALRKPRTNHGKRSFLHISSHMFNNMCAQMGDGDVGTVAFRSCKSLAKRVVRNV